MLLVTTAASTLYLKNSIEKIKENKKIRDSENNFRFSLFKSNSLCTLL